MRLTLLWMSACALAVATPAAGQHHPMEEGVPEPEGPAPMEERDAALYMGLGLSQVSADFSNLADALNLNLQVGAHLPWVRWLSAEGEMSVTVAPGNNRGGHTTTSPGTPCTIPPSELDPNGTPDGCGVPVIEATPGASASLNDLQMTNFGLFAAARTPGPVYALGRYGYRYVESSIEEMDDDKTGPAYTLGAGYRWRAGLSKFEVTYTDYSEHLEYLGIGVVYGFGATAEKPR